MSRVFLFRLCLDGTAAGLLVFGLSYWWLGDLAHEIAGSALLLLVAGHNVFNRRWYGRTVRSRPKPASLLNIGVTILLAATMLALLGTSAMISTVLPEWGSLGDRFDARRWHVLAAYWAFVIVAVHLGLRWPMIMSVTGRLLGITRPSRWRTGALRLGTLGIAACGLESFSTLQLGMRLTSQVSLDWWNFDDAVFGFFVHCAAAAGLLIALGHYAALVLRAAKPGSSATVT